MDTTELKPIIEAALLASSQPLSLPQIEAMFANERSVASADIVAALDALREDSSTRGIELVEVASGFRFQVRQDVHPWVAKLWTERPSHYSRALLETLALIAYRQPITRGEIEQVRGVAVSTHITRTLEEREWIRVVGHRETPGRPALFGTTRTFLDYFNLKSLDELPPLADILNLEELNPQLALGDDGSVQVGPPEASLARAEDGAVVDTDATGTTDVADMAEPEACDDDARDNAGVPDADADAVPVTVTTSTDPAAAWQEDPKENRA